jgi:hypothetical protein
VIDCSDEFCISCKPVVGSDASAKIDYTVVVSSVVLMGALFVCAMSCQWW